MSENAWNPLPQGILTDDFFHNLKLIQSAAHTEESEDVQVRRFLILGQEAALIYVDGMVSDTKIQHFLLQPALQAPPLPENGDLGEHLEKSVLPLCSLTPSAQLSTLLKHIFSGDAALICHTLPGALLCDVKGFVKRAVNQPVNETVIVGPHEGFTESLRENVVLIRRLLRSPALISEQMEVGEKVPTRICLLYLNGIARQETVQEVKRRLQGCHTDYVSSLGMLEQLIEDRPFSLFPQVAATERPDRAVSFLNEGQIVIAMENAPNVMAVPMGILHLYHAPDDSALRWQYGTFLRLLRLAGILIALLLPAVFIALTIYHPESMPLSLLTSVLETQARVPLSLFSSMLLMLLVFSLINEAGARIPGAMGGSLSIVSGLILGQAAVDADLFSPLIIIVVAISGLGSYTVPTFSLTLSLRLFQFLLLLAAGMAGYLGLVLGLFFLLMRMSGLTSMNHPYFSPLAPLRPSNPDSVSRLPIWRQRLRGAIANPFHMRRLSGRMRAWDQKEDSK